MKTFKQFAKENGWLVEVEEPNPNQNTKIMNYFNKNPQAQTTFLSQIKKAAEDAGKMAQQQDQQQDQQKKGQYNKQNTPKETVSKIIDAIGNT
jgi:hypothetical protein